MFVKSARLAFFKTVLKTISLVLLITGCSSTTKLVKISQPASFSKDALINHQNNSVPMAGAVSIDITPPPGLSMGGYSLMANSGLGFRTRLKARAIYLEDGKGGKLAYVQTDLSSGSLLLHHTVANLVADKLGLNSGQLTIAGTHSHSAPANMFHNDFYNKHFTAQKGLEENYLAFNAQRIANALEQAYEHRKPAKVATGQKDIYGINRNRALKAYARNKTVGDVNLKDPQAIFKHVDPVLRMVRIDVQDDSGQFKPLAALSGYSVHATTLPAPVKVYNADLFAYAQKDLQWAVQKKYNTQWPIVHALGTSAQGDMAPAMPQTGNNYFGHKPVSFKDSKRIGQALGKGAIELFEELGSKLTAHVQLNSASREIDLQKQNTIGDVDLCAKPSVGMATAAGAYERRTPFLSVTPFLKGGLTSRRWLFGKNGCHGAKRHLGTSLLQPLIEPSESFPRMALFQSHRINDMLILPVPFEVTSESARRMVTAAINAYPKNTIRYGWVASVSNGYFGYSTTPEEYSYQNYEGGHTLYGQYTTPFITAHLSEMNQSIASNKSENITPNKWQYQLALGEQMPIKESNSNVNIERKILSRVERYLAKNKYSEPYVSVLWKDVEPAFINLHKPVIKVEKKTDGQWVQAMNGNEPIHDDGYDIEVRYEKKKSKKIKQQGAGIYQARWYNPVKNGEYRFVILPRNSGQALYSESFSLK